jgi:enoyl-CoA hydratase/carnithine racemase
MLKETIDTGTHELLCEIADRVAIITLNRPEARKALSDPSDTRAAAYDQAVRDDPNVGAILITGAGGAFCPGGDVIA